MGGLVRREGFATTPYRNAMESFATERWHDDVHANAEGYSAALWSLTLNGGASAELCGDGRTGR